MGRQIQLVSNGVSPGYVMTWEHFQHYFPFVRGTHWSPVHSHHKGSVICSYGDLLGVSLNNMLNNQTRCRWFETPWLSCNIMVMFFLAQTQRWVLVVRDRSTASVVITAIKTRLVESKLLAVFQPNWCNILLPSGKVSSVFAIMASYHRWLITSIRDIKWSHHSINIFPRSYCCS